MCVFFKENQNVSRLAVVVIDIFFSDESTVSTSTIQNESSRASGEQILKNIALTRGAS